MTKEIEKIEIENKNEDISMLEELVGSKAKARTLMFLLENPIYEYTTQDIMENTGLARISVAGALEVLTKYGIVVRTRRVGRLEFYQIDLSNPIVEGFLELIKRFSRYLLNTETQEEYVISV